MQRERTAFKRTWDGLLTAAVLSTRRAIAAIRSPDDSKVKQKMLFASSKEALRRSLVGIATEIQGTDFSEVTHEAGASPHPSLYPAVAQMLTSVTVQCSTRSPEATDPPRTYTLARRGPLLLPPDPPPAFLRRPDETAFRIAAGWQHSQSTNQLAPELKKCCRVVQMHINIMISGRIIRLLVCPSSVEGLWRRTILPGRAQLYEGCPAADGRSVKWL